MIQIKRTTANQSSYHFYYDSIYLWDAIIDESGFYNFYFTDSNKGYWTSYFLRLVSDKIDELNRKWNDQIKKDIGSL